MRSACSATIARPKVSSSERIGIGAVEAAEQKALDDDAEQPTSTGAATNAPPKPMWSASTTVR